MTKILGLALGSGSDRGFAHIGVIKALEENQIPIHCISGSSMGAVIGAYYALHQESNLMEQIALQFSQFSLFQLVDLNNPLESLIKGEKIKHWLMDRLYGAATFEDCKIPFQAVATRLEDGEPEVLKTGLLVDAVMASASLPGILPPYVIHGVHLIDGGLAAAVPLDLLDTMGAEIRLGVDLYSYTSPDSEAYSLKDVLMRTYRLYMAKLSAATRHLNDDRTLVICPQTNEGLETLTFSHAAPNIQAGYRAAFEAIETVKRLLA